MMPTLAIAATHSTAPWYFAVPVVVLLGCSGVSGAEGPRDHSDGGHLEAQGTTCELVSLHSPGTGDRIAERIA